MKTIVIIALVFAACKSMEYTGTSVSDMAFRNKQLFELQPIFRNNQLILNNTIYEKR